MTDFPALSYTLLYNGTAFRWSLPVQAIIGTRRLLWACMDQAVYAPNDTRFTVPQEKMQ